MEKLRGHKKKIEKIQKSPENDSRRLLCFEKMPKRKEIKSSSETAMESYGFSKERKKNN